MKIFKDHVVPDHLTDKSIIVDLGACEGEFIKYIRSIGLLSKIYAVEPCRTNYSKLIKIEDDNLKLLMNFAVCGNNSGKMTFTEILNYAERGNLYSTFADKQTHITYQVDTIGPEELLKMLPLKIDYMKIDIEKGEYPFFKDMTIEQAERIGSISMEYHGDLDEIKTGLIRLGYQIQEYPNRELYCERF